MATIADLSGEEREQRAAELKRKMQEAAQKAKAAHDGPAAAPVSAPASVAVAAPVAQAAPVATLEADAPVAEAVTTEPATSEEAAVVTDATVAHNGNGTAAVTNGAASAPIAVAARPAVPVAAAQPVRDMTKVTANRREFLTYAWGAALGLLTLQAGVASFVFMYPRFRAGEFGGLFYVPISEVPPADQPPNGSYTAGKFWLVTNSEGERLALYMVCVHLGCLYKWVESNFRFECPCHGSKYTHDGWYIEGPAARSLDSFAVTEQGDELIVDTGNKILGTPAADSPFKIAVG